MISEFLTFAFVGRLINDGLCWRDRPKTEMWKTRPTEPNSWTNVSAPQTPLNIHHVRNNQQLFSLASFVGPPDFNLNPKRLPPSKTESTSHFPTPTLPRALGFGGPANKNLQISTRIRTTDQFCSSKKNKQAYPPPSKTGDGCRCFSKGVFADGYACANPLAIHLLQQAWPYQSVKGTTTVKALPPPHNESRRRPRYWTQHNVSCTVAAHLS